LGEEPYFIKDQALRFWFRYIFKNQSLIEIGDVKGLTTRIKNDLPTFMGKPFEELIKALLLKRNAKDIVPFRFTKIGGFWTRKGDVEIDIVALNEEEERIFFGECKLNGNKFTKGDVQRLKEKAEYVKWRIGKREEYFALFSMKALSDSTRKSLEKQGVFAYDLRGLLRYFKNRNG